MAPERDDETLDQAKRVITYLQEREPHWLLWRDPAKLEQFVREVVGLIHEERHQAEPIARRLLPHYMRWGDEKATEKYLFELEGLLREEDQVEGKRKAASDEDFWNDIEQWRSRLPGKL